MFRPAGFSDSEESEEGFSPSRSRSCYSSHEDQEIRRPSENTIIPWDTLNNNEVDMTVPSMSSDTTVSDPVLGPVLEKTKKYLRSTLLSHKGGVEMYALDSDYYELVGERIPYQKLNFNSLESLLRVLPSVCSIWRSGGQVMVKGVAGEASQHIQNMVAMQKTTVKGKSRKRGKGKKGGRFGQSSYELEMDSWHRQFAPPPSRTRKAPPPPTTHYRKSCPPPPAPSRSTSKPFVSTPTVKTIKSGQVTKLSENMVGVVTADMCLCGKRVRELLLGRQHGLYIAQLEKLYTKKFSESLPVDWTEELKSTGDITVVSEEGGLVLVKYGEGKTADPPENSTAKQVLDKKGEGEVTGLKDRVQQLLQGRAHGLLLSQVVKMYFNQWGEKLEEDWVHKLEHSGGFVVDREGEQVVLKTGVNGVVSQDVVTSKTISGLTSGTARVVVANNGVGGRREMVDKVRQKARLKQLLQGRLHGLYATQVEKMYQKTFGLTLENTWWSELMKEVSVEVETMKSGQVVVKWNKEVIS